MIKLRERMLKSGKIQLFLDIYYKGQRKFESLGIYLTGDRKQDKELREKANAIRSKRELEFYNDREGFTSTVKRKTNFYSFAKTVYEQKSIITQRTYINMLEYLRMFAGPDLTMDMVNTNFCEKFKNYLISDKAKEKGLRNINSAAAYFERFRSILRRAVEEDYIAKYPARGVYIKTEETLPKYLTVDQLQALARTPIKNTNIRDAFFFACYTGLRYSDVISLKWSQIQDDGIHLVQFKPKTASVIFLHNIVKSILKSRKVKSTQQTDQVFKFPRRTTVDKMLKRWAVRAQIGTTISFHSARHTFGTMIYSNVNDIYLTSHSLGHKNLETTKIYAKVGDDKIKKAIDALPTIPGII